MFRNTVYTFILFISAEKDINKWLYPKEKLFIKTFINMLPWLNILSFVFITQNAIQWDWYLVNDQVGAAYITP